MRQRRGERPEQSPAAGESLVAPRSSHHASRCRDRGPRLGRSQVVRSSAPSLRRDRHDRADGDQQRTARPAESTSRHAGAEPGARLRNAMESTNKIRAMRSPHTRDIMRGAAPAQRAMVRDDRRRQRPFHRSRQTAGAGRRVNYAPNARRDPSGGCDRLHREAIHATARTGRDRDSPQPGRSRPRSRASRSYKLRTTWEDRRHRRGLGGAARRTH